MKGDYRYAKATACRLTTQGLFASIGRRLSGRGSRLLAEVERLDWVGYGRGHVEFWPFTSGLLDLLGLRRYFVANTEGRLWRVHVGGAGPIGGRWNYAGGINLMDLWPSADVRHWRPVFLGFGVEDERFHKLGVSRVTAGMISASIGYSLSYWQVEYSLSQIVPLRVRQHDEPDSPDPSGSPRQDAGGIRGTGGGFHRLALRWYF
jgi:hypothetical protein